MNQELIDQYKELHKKKPSYGSGANFAKEIQNLINRHDLKSMVDFGCGKGNLKKLININSYCGYDPAIPEFSKHPRQADLVVANDVFEHFDPLLLMVELIGVAALASKAIFANISCRKAVEVLPNGENCHTALMPYWEWIDILNDLFSRERFSLTHMNFEIGNQNLVVVYLKNDFLKKQFDLTS